MPQHVLSLYAPCQTTLRALKQTLLPKTKLAAVPRVRSHLTGRQRSARRRWRDAGDGFNLAVPLCEDQKKKTKNKKKMWQCRACERKSQSPPPPPPRHAAVCDTQDVVQYLIPVALVTFHTRSPGAARTEGSDSHRHIVYVLPPLATSENEPFLTGPLLLSFFLSSLPPSLTPSPLPHPLPILPVPLCRSRIMARCCLTWSSSTWS